MSGGAAAGGQFISSIGSLVSGQSQADMLDTQAEIQRRNAGQAIIAAKQNADRQQLIAGKQIGSEEASYGASGVAMTGSVANVLAASAANAELDRQNILYGGQIRAINYENQASMDKISAKNALVGSYYGAAGAAIKGGTQAYAYAGGGGGDTGEDG